MTKDAVDITEEMISKANGVVEGRLYAFDNLQCSFNSEEIVEEISKLCSVTKSEAWDIFYEAVKSFDISKINSPVIKQVFIKYNKKLNVIENPTNLERLISYYVRSLAYKKDSKQKDLLLCNFMRSYTSCEACPRPRINDSVFCRDGLYDIMMQEGLVAVIKAISDKIVSIFKNREAHYDYLCGLINKCDACYTTACPVFKKIFDKGPHGIGCPTFARQELYKLLTEKQEKQDD